MDAKRKTSFGGLTSHSEETSCAGAFSGEGNLEMNSEDNIDFNTAEAKLKLILKCNYTPKEKADRLQEMEPEESKAEIEFPNPLFNICGSDPIKEDQYIDIPIPKGKTRDEEDHIENCIKASNIKKKRAAIYTSITKGEKTLMRKIQRSDQSKWDNIQTKVMAKIDHIIATLNANIPGMVEMLIEQDVREEKDFCDSLIDPSSRRSRSGCVHLQQQFKLCSKPKMMTTKDGRTQQLRLRFQTSIPKCYNTRRQLWVLLVYQV